MDAAPLPFTLTIAVEPPTPRAGEPVQLVVTLANHDALDARIEHWSPWFEFEPEITGPDGRELPRTRFGNQCYRARDAALTGTTTLAPDETLRVEIPYSRLFDLTLAGTYTVTVRREVRAPSTGEWIALKSNTLTFSLDG